MGLGVGVGPEGTWTWGFGASSKGTVGAKRWSLLAHVIRSRLGGHNHVTTSVLPTGAMEGVQHPGEVPPLVLCAALRVAAEEGRGAHGPPGAEARTWIQKPGMDEDANKVDTCTWRKDAKDVGVEMHPHLGPHALKGLPEGTGEGWWEVLNRVMRKNTEEKDTETQDPEMMLEEQKWVEFAMEKLVAGGKLAEAVREVEQNLERNHQDAGQGLEHKHWMVRGSKNYGSSDIAVWAQLSALPQWKAMKKKGTATKHVMELCDRLETSIPGLTELAKEHEEAIRPKSAKSKPPAVNTTGSGEGGKGKVKSMGAFVDLPGAEVGKVVTRFPPEPSGYLHIGHAKAALLNDYFAEKYDGKMLVRFDDTNPSKEKDEFVDNIIQDMKTLGLKFDTITYTSDYFGQLLDLCEKMILEGKMYADDTPTEKMRLERMDGIESRNRNASVEENLAAWEEMKAGTERGLSFCIRMKMDMQNPNKALRDPVCYRCNVLPHHRTGSKYKVYPTYDFACPYVDSTEGVTHALRSSEYKDREAQYYWMLKLMGIRKVKIWEFSRLNFVYTLLSKRKLQWFVDTGRVEGWFDPRFPTVQGITRRGLQVEALKEFILSQGSSKNINNMEWDKLWTMNKKVIDPVCPRHTAIMKKGKTPIHIVDGPEEPELVTLPRHKKNPDAGTKITARTKDIWIDAEDAHTISEGEEITLMDWGNCVITCIKKNPAGEVESLVGRLNLEGSVKTTKLKLTWLPDTEELVELTLVHFGYLITKKKLDEGENFEEFVNENSRNEFIALGDPNMRSIKKGEVLQLERKGFYICDEPYGGIGNPMVLFDIPDGRQK